MAEELLRHQIHGSPPPAPPTLGGGAVDPLPHYLELQEAIERSRGDVGGRLRLASVQRKAARASLARANYQAALEREPRALSETTQPLEKPRRSGSVVGRNAPCLCGSGKKYKKCCLGK